MTLDNKGIIHLSHQEIEDWLVTAIAHACRVKPESIDKNALFTDFGLDSIAAIEIVGDLEDFLQCILDETLLWDYPNISALAKYITSLKKDD